MPFFKCVHLLVVRVPFKTIHLHPRNQPARTLLMADPSATEVRCVLSAYAK
jgi:hypothetical protein